MSGETVTVIVAAVVTLPLVLTMVACMCRLMWAEVSEDIARDKAKRAESVTGEATP